MFDFSGFNFDRISPGSPSKMAGSDGVAAPGGYLYVGERNPKLIGDQKWVTFSNLIRNTLVVAASIRIYDTFARSVRWYSEPNGRGGKKAQKMADLATEGLLEATMPKPWQAVVGKSITGASFQGFAMHEWQGARQNTPGRPWVFTNLEHRPQHTIHQWIKPSEREPWIGVVQRTKTGGTYPIARSRLFYVSDDTFTDSPDGAGYLQHLTQHADHLRAFERHEGIAYQTNLAGTPVSRAPLGQLRNEAIQALGLVAPWGQDGETKINGFIQTQVRFLTDFMENHVKTPDLGLTLDSAVYAATGDGKTTPSSIYKWAIDTMRTSGLSLEEVAAAINRVGRELARVMGTEHMLMGDSEGARSVHGDKTDLLLMRINGLLSLLGYYATSQLAWPMTELNGFDPFTCTPRLRPHPIPLESLEEVCAALGQLAKARGPLPAQWEGTDVILARADLPPLPELDLEADAMLPRGRKMPEPDPAREPSPRPDPGDDSETPDNNPGAGETS